MPFSSSVFLDPLLRMYILMELLKNSGSLNELPGGFACDWMDES